MPKPAVATGTRKSVQQALDGLTDADLLRLRRFAQLRAAGLRSVTWQDLFQEAIARLLDGTRAWPDDVAFVVLMLQTLRSIANEHWRRSYRSPVKPESEHEIEVADSADLAPSPEQSAVCDDLLGQIAAQFADDPHVLAVLRGMAQGETPAEIQAAAAMSTTEYASAQKRIRRGVARVFPDGGVR